MSSQASGLNSDSINTIPAYFYESFLGRLRVPGSVQGFGIRAWGLKALGCCMESGFLF